METDLCEIDAALLALNEAADINDRHAAKRKGDLERSSQADSNEFYAKELLYHQNERDRMLNFQRMGRLYLAKNEPEAARISYEKALEISLYFLRRYPESELSATDIAMNFYSLGDVSQRENDFQTAAEHYESGLNHALAVADKKSSPLLLELTIAGRLGLARSNARLFHLDLAIQHYGSAIKAVREAAQNSPGDVDLQWRFLRANDEAAEIFGLVHLSHGLDVAMQCYDNSLETCTMMLGTGYRNKELFRYLQHCYEQKSVIAEIQGNLALAQTFSNHAQDVAGWLRTDSGMEPHR